MPTQDASAFTRQQKLRAIQAQVRTDNLKVITHLYEYVPPSSALTDFLPTFTNKFITPCRQPLINYPAPKINTASSGPTPGFTNFWNYEMYKRDPSDPTEPTIDDPTTWGTRNDTMLVELMTTGSGTPCSYGTDGTIIPRKVDPKWDFIVLHVTGFFTAPSTGTYIFTVASDDGVQFRIGSTLIIDDPGFDTFNGNSDPIILTSGTKYPIDLLWANGAGGLNCCFTQFSVNGIDQMPGVSFNDQCSPT
jgi:hypothetical protein